MKTIIKKILFRITFKRVPKKQFGRCIMCKASDICHKIKVCKCTFDQQYELRIKLTRLWK